MHYSQPGWSPDGRQLVFKGSGYVSGFFVTNADGTGIRIITSSENDYHPRLSPDNQYIVFSRDISSAYVAQRHIYMMGIDGSYLRCLTQIWVEATPTPLPRDTNGTSRERNIIMTVRPEHKFNDDPDWSPDGNTIVFTSYSGAAYADRKNGQIYSVKVDGTDLKRLTNNAYNDQHPVWSPDGKRIAFSSSRDRANSFEIYTMDKDGRNLHLMTDLKSGKALYPTWSPDSKYIAFEYNDGLDQWGSIRVLRVDEAPESFLIAQTMIGHEHIQPVWKPK
jgi:Tol biopolymer transport system component